MNLSSLTMNLSSLAEIYNQGVSPLQVWQEFRRRLAAYDDPALFISLAEEADLAPLFERLATADRSKLPLFGVPFAVKDNIDWSALPTTAACPAFSYRPEASAAVVDALIAAGAFPVGKANLDQFATGLVGTRSPYGTPRNPVAPGFIPGGSSSGSAAAVSAGLVAFSLGTDTAGSGRVPAAFQGLIGWKPTRGLVSTRGVVPACRTLDCVSVFARSVAEAQTIASVISVFDAADPYSRPIVKSKTAVAARPRIGVPSQGLGGRESYTQAWLSACQTWVQKGAELVEFDASVFLEAARLLYEGPWVAERLASAQTLWKKDKTAFHPVTRAVLQTAEARDAVGAFEAFYRVEALKRQSEAVWKDFDFLLFPTAPTLPTLAEVEADPLGVNSLLGTWTNFFNLFDLAGLALPAGSTDGRPFGVTLVGPAGSDQALFEAGKRIEGEGFGAASVEGPTVLAVTGAHLRGLPLNGQLLERGARFLGEAASAPRYQLYAFQDGKIEKPGMVRAETGISVPLELWDMPEAGWAGFLKLIPHPLGLGKVELADGRWVTGFLMESSRVPTSRDIAEFGGWRKYLASKA